MTIKRIVTIAILLALFTVIGVQRVQMADGSVSPESPGALRVVEDGEWLLFRDYLCAHASITVSADRIRVRRHGRSVTVSVRWTESNHTFVNADIITESCEEVPTASSGR